MDYTIFYKRSFTNGILTDGVHYDVFLSAFDDCDRTREVFDRVSATIKQWIIFPHYGLPVQAGMYTSTATREDEFFDDMFQTLNLDAGLSICIDITGFLRPHLIFLLAYLNRNGHKKIDLIYTEPLYYRQAEETDFSGFPSEVRPIEGCGPITVQSSTDDDLMIITAGYDDKLIAQVIQTRRVRRKHFILGLPSLQADFYQESRLKLNAVKESTGPQKIHFAPAWDPFVTAQVVSDIIEKAKKPSNIYLSPISTKPHAIGLALFYFWNFRQLPVSIIFPFSAVYHPKTAVGVKRTWKYVIELPA